MPNPDFSNTPISDAPKVKKCQYCSVDGKEKSFCSLLPKRKQLYWMDPCSYLQELICPRALTAKRGQIYEK